MFVYLHHNVMSLLKDRNCFLRYLSYEQEESFASVIDNTTQRTGLVGFGVVWLGLVWSGLVRIWFDLVWFGLVWSGQLFGLVWFGPYLV